MAIMLSPISTPNGTPAKHVTRKENVLRCLNPGKSYYRFVVLFFCCLMSFGNYYCFDMPSVLQNDFQAPRHCPPNVTNCTEGLGMSAQQYNLLYAIYSWTNAVVVLFSGFFIDRVGNMIGALVFTFFCFLGASVFAFGSTIENSTLMMVCMLGGRLLFGAGDGSVTIVQYRLCSMWFKNKELAFAFSMKLVVSRLGSTLNFLLTNKIVSLIGVWKTLVVGAGLCGLGFLSAFVVGFLDIQGMKIRHKRNFSISSEHVNESSTGGGVVQLRDVKRLNRLYWFIVSSIVFFYCTLFPFVADSAMFVGDKYGYDNDKSSLIAGSLYDVSLVVMPIIGGVVDYFGFRGLISSTAQFATIPIFFLFTFDNSIHPLPVFIWYGVTYSLTASVLWSCIPLVVDPAIVGTAMGLASFVQMLGIGCSNMVVGAFLDHGPDEKESMSQWKNVMIYFLCTTIMCTICSITFCSYDLIFGTRILNRGKRYQSIQYTKNITINADHSDLRRSSGESDAEHNQEISDQSHKKLHDSNSRPNSTISTSSQSQKELMTHSQSSQNSSSSSEINYDDLEASA
ncbi:lysosomal dipeptide transporter MFSD1-like isoform X3 [Convolutriloba macropyga]|uniref:lysosomal dipeptide transporter MFSD1-like isoform X3 n=1 Tax=Convolutriloba macropyga TaxID=536237 RepID=UPI003F5217B2